MRLRSYDVAIIGAGFVGSALAERADRSTLRVSSTLKSPKEAIFEIVNGRCLECR